MHWSQQCGEGSVICMLNFEHHFLYTPVKSSSLVIDYKLLLNLLITQGLKFAKLVYRHTLKQILSSRN